MQEIDRVSKEELFEALGEIRDKAYALDDGSIWMDYQTPIGLYVDMLVNRC